MSLSTLVTRLLTGPVPPENAHHLAVRALELGLFPQLPKVEDPRLEVTVAGLRFANPLGMAAGFDKDARAFPALFALGFGHVEVGTLTPLAQAGNPQPRIFRLRADEALINRMGFNNEGLVAARKRILAWRRRGYGGRGVLGVNIGANKRSLDRVADYAHGARCMAPVADYLAINISSPNTPGLRNLQSATELTRLLAAVMQAMDAAGRRVPVFVKIAPDLHDADIEPIVAACIQGGAAGMIVSNTTIARPASLQSPHKGETGGLSGRPLFVPSTRLLARVRKLAGRRLALIGVGGVSSAEDVWEKMRAGADLVQIYTGFIWQGPEIVPRILSDLAERCAREGLSSITEITGSGMAEWAQREISA